MKKSAIALAVAAALGLSATANAATTLYGSARASLNYVDEGGDSDAHMTFRDNGSRLGVRGNEDLGSGLKAIYNFEFGLNVATDGSGQYWTSNRPRFLGLEGGFGTIRAGTMFTPEYDLNAIVDTFNFSESFAASTIGSRTGFLARYDSPSFSGFNVQAAARFDGTIRVEEYLDMWNIVGKYDAGGILAGFSYLQNESLRYGAQRRDGRRWSVALGYTVAPILVGFTWERGNFNGSANTDSTSIRAISGFRTPADERNNIATFQQYYANVFQLNAEYTFGANTVRGYYGRRKFDDVSLRNRQGNVVASSPDDVNFYNVGFQHRLSRRTRLWVEYGGLDEPDNQHLFSVGMRHDF